MVSKMIDINVFEESQNGLGITDCILQLEKTIYTIVL